MVVYYLSRGRNGEILRYFCFAQGVILGLPLGKVVGVNRGPFRDGFLQWDCFLGVV